MEFGDQPTTPETVGYQRLADFMAWDETCSLFARLKSANYLNLLGLQAEVCCIVEDIMDSFAKDEDSQTGILNWRKIIEDEQGQSAAWQNILKLRSRLNDYSTFR